MKAFLSHTSLDKDLVALVHEKLSPLNAWYDAADIENGESIPEKINEGLKFATHYILFWSDKASKSPWVRAELNAAFVNMLARKCKFMVFLLDNTELPELLKPYKFDKIDKTDLNKAATLISQKVLEQGGAVTCIDEIVNRSKEVGEIEDAVRAGYKLIILTGMLGIGKLSVAEKSLAWLYPNRAAHRIILDFSRIPGVAELALELSRKSGIDLYTDNHGLDNQRSNIQYFLEVLSSNNTLLILKDVKSWLAEDGSANENLQMILEMITDTDLFSVPVIMTSSRFVTVPLSYGTKIKQIKLQGLNDQHTAEIIRNNLPRDYKSDPAKNLAFAQRLFGYPLGAKLGANYIANFGYDYYLEQPSKFQSLTVGLAKDLVAYAGVSKDCLEYLKMLALTKSKLRNEEYAKAFPDLSEKIAELADEAFFAGITKFDDDGCYQLEPIVEDYFYSVAFNTPDRVKICKQLGDFLISYLKKDNEKRLIPAAIHVLTLSGRIKEALAIRSELIQTMIVSMWDQYNHMEYDDAKYTASELVAIDADNFEAQYMIALCLTRFDQYDEAESILATLLKEDSINEARYHHALGRIKKRQGLYLEAIDFFHISILKRARFLSPYREMAECFIFLRQYEDAWDCINCAKEVDNSNLFVTLLEARLLQKEGHAERAVELLEHKTSLNQAVDQVYFRKGRAYDQLGAKEKACDCYKKALEYNPKMYDAALCLLNHTIMINSISDVEKEIESIRTKLRGKRKAVLTNIEARFIGYVKKNIVGALQLLDGVNARYRDRQWYAVKIQLIENQISEYRYAGRRMMLNKCNDELLQIKTEFRKIYGEETPNEFDFIPDA